MSSTTRALLGQDAKSLPISDEEVVRRVRAGETGLFEVVMRRYNQRLYRVARAILRDDGEAEDVTQQAYLNAYRHPRPIRRSGYVFDLADQDRGT